MPTTLSNQTARVRRHRKSHAAWESATQRNPSLVAQMQDVARKYPALTDTELKVCALVLSGLSCWQIAETLRVAEGSIEKYRVRIRRKLNLGKEKLLHYLTAGPA